MNSYKIVIPARFASTRLPGKPLIKLAGKPMSQHVYERARATAIADIVIATDDDRIEAVAKEFGAEVVMTSANHEKGTERIAEVARIKEWSQERVIGNLQGYEQLIQKSFIEITGQVLFNNHEKAMSSV